MENLKFEIQVSTHFYGDVDVNGEECSFEIHPPIFDNDHYSIEWNSYPISLMYDEKDIEQVQFNELEKKIVESFKQWLINKSNGQ